PLGAFTSLTIAVQGIAIASGDDRYSVFVDAAGLPVAVYGAAMFVGGVVAFAVSVIGVDRRLTMASAQAPAAFLLLVATTAGALFVSPAYLFLGASAYLRAF